MQATENNNKSRKQHKTKRSVRFASNREDGSLLSPTIILPLLVPSSQMSDSERRLHWYQPQEYQAQQYAAKNIAVAIRRREPCDPKRNPSSYSTVLSRVFSSCLNTRMNGLTRSDLEKLSHWTSVAHSRRGLERMSLPQVSQVRKECRDAVMQAVFEAQRNGNNAETIRLSSERRSKPSRIFATVMGKADAVAAEGEYYGSTSLANKYKQQQQQQQMPRYHHRLASENHTPKKKIPRQFGEASSSGRSGSTPTYGYY